MPKHRAPLLVVDAPLLLYRAYFAMPDSIKGADGEPVNALLGSTNYILQAVAKHAPRAVVACIGQETATYRAELYPPYHAHRPPMPDDLAAQFVKAASFYPALGWQVEMHDDLEADDLLASLAEAETKAGGRTLVLTGDRDLYQLASDQVTVLYIPGGSPAASRPTRSRPPRCASATASARSSSPTSSRCAATPRTGCPAAPESARRPHATSCSSTARWRGRSPGRCAERPRVAEVLRRDADELRRFKDIATVVRVSRTPPPDAQTDYAAGAAAARERGMNALARRLDELAAGAS